MISLIPYIGGKHRIAKQIALHLHATGADTLVDVFGGSAAVLLNSGFKKRVYNDISGDLVCLFRTLADPTLRVQLFRRLRWMPPSRQIYDEFSRDYLKNCFSFSYLPKVERAAATFYRHHYCFGGKSRCGGFQVSLGDRQGIKEITRYRNTLRRLSSVGDFFSNTLIEHLNFQQCVSMYGKKVNCVLFIDPPYVGTEGYYSYSGFCRADHIFLAHQLADCPASVVCTYYDNPLIRDLYPENLWRWERIVATKNSQFRNGNKAKMLECILIKGGIGCNRLVPEHKQRDDPPQPNPPSSGPILPGLRSSWHCLAAPRHLSRLG